jgi:hypothetical protein
MEVVITPLRLGLAALLILHRQAQQEATVTILFFLRLHLLLAVVERLLTGTVEAAALEVAQGVKTQAVQLLAGQHPLLLLGKETQEVMVGM